MKRHLFAFLGLLLCAGALSSCSGGGEKPKNYSLSVNQFMAGRKYILLSTTNCALLIKPKQLDSSEIYHSSVTCAGQVYVYQFPNGTDLLGTYDVDNMTYNVDDAGNGYLRFPSIAPNGISGDSWQALCGALASTGAVLGGTPGEDKDYVRLSDVFVSLYFSGEDKGGWEDTCNAALVGEVENRRGNGSLLLRPDAYLYEGKK